MDTLVELVATIKRQIYKFLSRLWLNAAVPMKICAHKISHFICNEVVYKVANFVI